MLRTAPKLSISVYLTALLVGDACAKNRFGISATEQREPVDRRQAEDYANRWIASWNRLDIEDVLATFAEDVVFSSPRAMEGLGVPTIHGKQAMREYWQAGLPRIQNLRFTLVRTIWDEHCLAIAIIYDREVNGQRGRATEIMQFDRQGRVVSGEVFHGVVPQGKR
jgi:ketosteroid isomerase-like protein